MEGNHCFQFEEMLWQGERCAVLTGHTGKPQKLDVPAFYQGLPVRAVAPHALEKSPRLKEAVLPESLQRLGSFSFHGCPRLTDVVLTDAVTEYEDGALRSCTALSRVTLTIKHNHYRILRDILSDSDGLLRFHLILETEAAPGQAPPEATLLFPGYLREAREDTFARTIHFATEGPGVAYRECVLRSGIDWAGYDKVFVQIADAFSPEARDIALLRLTSGYRLREDHAAQYRAYLLRFVRESLESLMTENDTEGLQMLAEETPIPADVLRDGIVFCSARVLTEASALLTQFLYEARDEENGPAPSVPYDLFVPEEW